MISTEPFAGPAVNAKPVVPRGWMLLFVLVTVLFYLWGAANTLNDVLIRQFMKSFELSRLQAGFVQSAFYMGYFVLAIPAALLMRRFGYKFGMVAGLLLFGSGTFLFWPAAAIGRYGFFLFALFVIGSGLSFLETAANPFIAELGAPETAERRLNLAQAFNPLGNISGTLMGTIFIFSGVEKSASEVSQMKAGGAWLPYAHAEMLRVVPVYIVVSTVVFIWAALLSRARFPVIAAEHEGAGHDRGSFGQLFGFRHFRLAVIAQFLYVGGQVCTWSYFIPYVQTYTHQPEKVAGLLLTVSLSFCMIGRFFSTWLMQFIRPSRLMAIYGLANVTLCAMGIFIPGWTGMIALLVTTFFMSIMFPTIFALGIKGLGVNTKIGGACIVMGIVGGAVLTPLMGKLSLLPFHNSLAHAFVVPLLCYLFIAWYSFSGYQIRTAEG